MKTPLKKSKKAGAAGAPAIVTQENPVLRQVAKDVPVKEIGSDKIKKVIRDMKAALAEQGDGIGLAAPQIGVPLRIFIVSKNVLGTKDDAKKAKAGEKSPVIDDMVFINPVITKESKEKKWMEGEGCLSVRWIYGKVKRSTKVTIRAHDEHGKILERGAGGLLAHIFQHEVDHLNGILFIDKAKDLEEMDPEDLKK
jgi:peptide deformylase